MHNNHKKRKALMLLMAMAALLSVPIAASAQYDGSWGVFGRGFEAEAEPSRSLMGGATGGYELHNQQFGSDDNGGYNLYNQTFGQEAPLGSGLPILTAAGAGYALRKRKNNKNQKS